MILGNGPGSDPSPEDFEEELERLVHNALSHDIDVEGAWDISVGEGSEETEYTVEIYRMSISQS